MIHTRLQLDPRAELSLRVGRNDTVEILVIEPDSDASCVIEMSSKQFAGLCEDASVS